ncbi:recombinase family protein [Sphingobacterium sp. UBA6308]|uniref:recombinase family protein n=1 Tax=Sphingobacterium sp. UBA6308 TaxID=1947508 RepID=UPI002580A93D|nr:recombinase family protein [Sphingobacterium sp. UBA6308]
MNSAYIYVRVSTDEQKKKGYSLPEQEDRLLKYCNYNNIEVKGIYREDFSAKNFNRPEWKKLINVIKSSPKQQKNNIIFIKWDRFSRNIEYAYEMIGILRKYRTTATAIDQPIDFSVPESTVMLAVYLSIPEAENRRRALNTANGIRRAKQMGRYPGKAPVGFLNITEIDGREAIVPKQPEAGIIKWVFNQLAKNTCRIEDIRKIADDKGLKCSRSYFFKLIRNPAYCGLIPIRLTNQEEYMVKSNHIPLITETLFYEVQRIVTTKRKIETKNENLSAIFFLKGFLKCPICGRKLSASFSKGYSKRYPYYHCKGRCPTRINANLLNTKYEEALLKLRLSTNALPIFNYILKDWNTNTQKTSYERENRQLQRKLKDAELNLSQVRKLFISGILKLEDYTDLKKEYLINIHSLQRELQNTNTKLDNIEKRLLRSNWPLENIMKGFSEMDTTDKKHVVSLFPPTQINFKSGGILIKPDPALSKLLLHQ